MAYVPTAKHDVFITYPINVWKWAENFEHDLGEELEQSLPSNELAIYLTRRGWILGGTSTDTLTEAEQSVLFVAVLPSVISSYDCRIFQAEWDAFKRSRGVFGLAPTRFVAVFLEGIDPRRINRVFGIIEDENVFQSCFQFQFEDEVGFTHVPARSSPSGVYSKKIAEVARHLDGRLRHIKQLILLRHA
jgi:hypothetical protein